MDMAKTYNPSEFEKEIYQEWESKGYFTAKVDAEKLTEDVLNLLVANDDGVINTSDNHNFISAVITKVFKNEDLNNVVGADGRLSARGLERITNAIFYKAYGDASLSARLSESLDNDMKNATKVLLISTIYVIIFSNSKF